MAGGVLGIFILFGVSVARETTQKTLLIYRVIHLETYFSVSLKRNQLFHHHVYTALWCTMTFV